MAAFTGFVGEEIILRHGHLACGIGGGGKGFKRSNPRVGHIRGRWKCVGGIDVDREALRKFERVTGGKGTWLDLFSRDQYFAFHGKAPPTDYHEAMPADMRRAYGDMLDVLFMSLPCKGFSGLLSAKMAGTAKYEALNGLTLRSIWLVLEAYKDDPIPIILFENVPRIRTRGRALVDKIKEMMRAYGYNVVDHDHDCGELGNLAQSRTRFLMIARHPVKLPPFVYQPAKHKLRGVGEVIGMMPLPGDPIAGPMHRVPELQWKTWVRLALVPAGRDWRALNELRVEDGVLADYGIVPEIPLRDGALGVYHWRDSAGVVVGNQRSPLHGKHSIADPRPQRAEEQRHDYLGVNRWSGSASAISSRGGPTNGAYSLADPRPGYGENTHRYVLGVNNWNSATGVIGTSPKPTCGANAIADPRPGYSPKTHQNILSVARYAGSSKTVSGAVHVAGGALSVADPRPNPMMNGGLGVVSYSGSIGVVAGETMPTNGAYAIADIRIDGHPKSVQLGVKGWKQTAGVVKGKMDVGQGPYAIADVRIPGKPRFNSTYRIVKITSPSPAVAGPGGPAGGLALADPRHAATDYTSTKYKITAYEDASRAVIGASTTGDGAFALADPRVTWGNGRHEAVMRVTRYEGHAGAVPGAVHSVTGGQPCVADQRREHYQTCGHYGVVGWNGSTGVISATLSHDNGAGNVADPREIYLDSDPIILPKPEKRLVCRIISTDDCWHRPFTTLELAGLQSWFIPEEVFEFDRAEGLWQVNPEFAEEIVLDGRSDAVNREWIGNMVPPASAEAMANEIGEALLLAKLGETFTLSSKEIWVSPVRAALAIDHRQVALEWDGQA